MDDEKRESLLAAIEPNHKSYITVARRRYVGKLEHIADNVLYGWCWQVGSLEPVELDCFVGTERIPTFKAADFRSDLLAAKCAKGYHGFSLELRAIHSESGTTCHGTGHRS